MVNKDFYVRLLMRPYWQQQLILVITSLLLFLITGYIVMMAHQYQMNAVNQQQSDTRNQLASLEKKMERMPTETCLMRELKGLQTQPILRVPGTVEASLIMLSGRSGMVLRQINLITQRDRIGWQLELTGHYQQFIVFLKEFSKLTWPIAIHRIEIRTHRDRLIFLLMLLSF